MKNDSRVPIPHKIFLNTSLIMLGICANGTFFSLMVTLLLGTVVLGYLRNQPKQVLLTSYQKIEEVLKTPVLAGREKDT